MIPTLALTVLFPINKFPNTLAFKVANNIPKYPSFSSKISFITNLETVFDNIPGYYFKIFLMSLISSAIILEFTFSFIPYSNVTLINLN